MANISDFISAGGGGEALTPILSNTNDEQISATSGDYYIVTAAGVQITLPESPSIGDVVRVYNRGGQDEIVIVFPGRIPIVDPQTEAPIRGQIELEDTASYEFTYDGASWNLVFSGYFVGTPSDTSGLSLGYTAVVNAAGTITFGIQVDGMAAAPGATARTGVTTRITANVTDPDQPDGQAFIFNWPSLAELNMSSSGNTWTIVSGGGNGDNFIELSNTAEEAVLINVSATDASGNTFNAQYNHVVANNLAPVVTLTAGAGSAAVGENIVTDIINVVDAETAGTFPANASSYTITWSPPTGADVVSGCQVGDTNCTLRSTSDLRDATLRVVVEDAGAAQGIATRELTWAQAGPPITANAVTSSNNGMQAFSATAAAIAAPFHTFIGSYDGTTIPTPTVLTGSTTTATVQASPCPNDHTQNWYAYGYNPDTGLFTATTTSSSVLSFSGSVGIPITTTGFVPDSSLPFAPLTSNFGTTSRSSGGNVTTNCAGTVLSSSWSISQNIRVFNRYYWAPGTGGSATLSTGETDSTVAISSSFHNAQWSGTLSGNSTAARTATVSPPTLQRMGWFTNSTGSGGTVSDNSTTNGSSTSTNIVLGDAAGANPQTVFGASIPINVTSRVSNGIGSSATWTGSTVVPNNQGSAGIFTGTITTSGGTNNSGTMTISGTFVPTTTIFSRGSTITTSLRFGTINPTVGGTTQGGSDFRLLHSFLIRFTA